ncbi:hypothetical protein [Nonomuraea sp. NPDC049784]
MAHSHLYAMAHTELYADNHDRYIVTVRIPGGRPDPNRLRTPPR